MVDETQNPPVEQLVGSRVELFFDGMGLAVDQLVNVCGHDARIRVCPGVLVVIRPSEQVHGCRILFPSACVGPATAVGIPVVSGFPTEPGHYIVPNATAALAVALGINTPATIYTMAHDHLMRWPVWPNVPVVFAPDVAVPAETEEGNDP